MDIGKIRDNKTFTASEEPVEGSSKRYHIGSIQKTWLRLIEYYITLVNPIRMLMLSFSSIQETAFYMLRLCNSCRGSGLIVKKTHISQICKYKHGIVTFIDITYSSCRKTEVSIPCNKQIC